MTQTMATETTAARAPWWWLRWVGFGLIVVGIALAYILLPLKDWLTSIAGTVESLGVLGVMLYVAIYVVFCTFLLPAALVSILAGVAFGMWGFAIALPSATLAASIAFLISRYLFSGRFRTWLLTKPRLSAVERAVNQKGAGLVFFLRLSPMMPFPVLNYIFGLTLIPFRKYVLATFFGLVPINFMWAYVGTIGRDLTGAGGNEPTEVGTAKIVMGVVGGVITLAVTFWVGRAARKAMREAAESTPRQAPVTGRSALDGASQA